MKKDITVSQRELVLKEVLEYIEKYDIECGDDVINNGEAALESKYSMAEIVDIILETLPHNDSYKGLQDY